MSWTVVTVDTERQGVTAELAVSVGIMQRRDGRATVRVTLPGARKQHHLFLDADGRRELIRALSYDEVVPPAGAST